MIWVVWSATCFRVFLARTSGSARAASTVSGSSGQSGVSATYPASSNSAAQLSQLEGSSHSPWMKRTGVAVFAFARSTCSRSRSVIEVEGEPSLRRTFGRRGRGVHLDSPIVVGWTIRECSLLVEGFNGRPATPSTRRA